MRWRNELPRTLAREEGTTPQLVGKAVQSDTKPVAIWRALFTLSEMLQTKVISEIPECFVFA